jgi:hypothetical protein
LLARLEQSHGFSDKLKAGQMDLKAVIRTIPLFAKRAAVAGRVLKKTPM